MEKITRFELIGNQREIVIYDKKANKEIINLEKASWKDKFIRVDTGEICEIVGKTKEGADLRPINYHGLMVYHEIYGCPNEQSNWKKL